MRNLNLIRFIACILAAFFIATSIGVGIAKSLAPSLESDALELQDSSDCPLQSDESDFPFEEKEKELEDIFSDDSRDTELHTNLFFISSLRSDALIASERHSLKGHYVSPAIGTHGIPLFLVKKTLLI